MRYHLLPHAYSVVIGVLTILSAGCGTIGFAPDSVVENPAADRFLTKLGQECGMQRIGDQTIAYLLDVNNNDTYFVDESTKLYLGDVSRAQYASDINGFYPSDANQGAIDCIFSKLPR